MHAKKHTLSGHENRENHSIKMVNKALKITTFTYVGTAMTQQYYSYD